MEHWYPVLANAPYPTTVTMKATVSTEYDYFTARGLRPTAPKTLNAALRTVLDDMPTVLYGDPAEEFTPSERKALIDGGVRVDAEPDGDPLAENAIDGGSIARATSPGWPPSRWPAECACSISPIPSACAPAHRESSSAAPSPTHKTGPGDSMTPTPRFMASTTGPH